MANVLPLYLVITGQWSLVQILLLFWIENVIIGGLNIIKILTCADGGLGSVFKKLFMASFFTIHYGIFTWAHGLFIVEIFAQQEPPDMQIPSFALVVYALQTFALLIPAFFLLGSHLFSLVINYYKGGEYRRTNTGELMSKPYGRVVILHVTVLVGGFIAQALGEPLMALVVLVILKVMIDIAAHDREHKEKRVTADTTSSRVH